MKIFKLKKESISIERFLALLPYLTITISIVSTLFTFWFIYNNIIIVANDAIELQSLSQDVVKTKLNTKLYESVDEELTKKKKAGTLDASSLRNPFETIQEPPPTIINVEESLEQLSEEITPPEN